LVIITVLTVLTSDAGVSESGIENTDNATLVNSRHQTGPDGFTFARKYQSQLTAKETCSNWTSSCFDYSPE